MSTKKKVVKDNVPLAVEKKKCGCEPVTCRAIAKCLGKMALWVVLRGLVLAMALGILVGIYDLGRERGLDRGVVEVLNAKSPCVGDSWGTRGSYLGQNYRCGFNEDNGKFEWYHETKDNE